MMRYWVNDTQPESGAPIQPEHQQSVCDAAWSLLILAYDRFRNTDDNSGQVGAGLYYVGRLFTNADTTDTDADIRDDIRILCSYVRRIAKRKLGEAAEGNLGEYLKMIGLSADDWKDAWSGLTALDAWLEKRDDEKIGFKGIERVPSDANKRTTIMDAIGEYAREPPSDGKIANMVFDSGGSQTITFYSGHGRQLNHAAFYSSGTSPPSYEESVRDKHQGSAENAERAGDGSNGFTEVHCGNGKSFSRFTIPTNGGSSQMVFSSGNTVRVGRNGRWLMSTKSSSKGGGRGAHRADGRVDSSSTIHDDTVTGTTVHGHTVSGSTVYGNTLYRTTVHGNTVWGSTVQGKVLLPGELTVMGRSK